MGKHQYVTCFRCGVISGASHVDPTYGCRKCKAKLTPAQKRELHDALITANRTKRAAAKDVEAVKDRLQTRLDRESAPDDVFLQISAQRRAQAAPAANPVQLAENNALIEKLVAEQDYVKSVDKAMAAFSAHVQRCECCQVPWHAPAPRYVETFDCKLLCPHCAYAIVRCGACPLHNNVLYPEIAATIPRIHPRDYPPEVLAPFDAAAFD